MSHLMTPLTRFLSDPGTPRLLLPLVALLLIVVLPLTQAVDLWLMAAGIGAVLIALDKHNGAGQWALYLIGAALIGMILGAWLIPFWQIQPRITLEGIALLGLAYVLSRLQHPVAAQPASSTFLKAAAPGGDAVSDDLTVQMLVTADGMVKAAQAIKEVAVQQSAGALEQVDVIQTTNEKIEKFMELSNQIMDETRVITRTAQEATGIAVNGQQALEQVLSGMEAINEQVSVIGQTILKLAQLTRRIDEIITSVSEIATQSNLLALNASIEAARAGTHGRGFAVVAEEVRSLSQQSTTAARQIRTILGEIQSAVRDTVDATESGVGQVENGVQSTHSANRVMAQLSTNVMRSYETIRGISNIIREQADGMDEITINMSRINQITQQNLVSTRVVDRIAQNLTQLADELQESVGTEAIPQMS